MDAKRSFKKENGECPKKRISNKDRHVSWNYEPLNEPLISGAGQLLYHMIIVDNKNLEQAFNSIVYKLASSVEPIDVIRTKSGHVANSNNQYLFKSFKSPAKPDLLSFGKYASKRDFELYERKRHNFSIENYIEDKYGKK
jgi:hypothetical protein